MFGGSDGRQGDEFSTAVLDELLRSGPFHTALRLTIEARGLTLERLRDHLARRGHRVSVSSLSNWQRGVSRPDHARSREALAALEGVLGVPPGALLELLGPRRHQFRGSNVVLGMSRTESERMRTELGLPPQPPTAIVNVHERLVIGPTDRESWIEDRLTVVAHQSGVDRHIVFYNASDGMEAEVSAGTTCRLGRTRRNRSGLIAAELVFDRPLSKGETYPLEYQVRSTDVEPRRYTGRWFRTAGTAYDLAVRFETEQPPSASYRIWRLDPATPHKDRAELRLIDGRIAHLSAQSLEPGFHGIRWTWP